MRNRDDDLTLAKVGLDPHPNTGACALSEGFSLLPSASLLLSPSSVSTLLLSSVTADEPFSDRRVPCNDVWIGGDEYRRKEMWSL